MPGNLGHKQIAWEAVFSAETPVLRRKGRLCPGCGSEVAHGLVQRGDATQTVVVCALHSSVHT